LEFRRVLFRSRGDFTSPALSTSGEQFSVALRLHELWADRSRAGSGESVRNGMGRRVRTKIVQAARDDVDQFALRGFCGAPKQSIGARAGGWQVGAKVQTRSGRAIAIRRRQFVGE